MSLLVTDCPRCGTKSITFDVLSQHPGAPVPQGWNQFEIFCICRACKHSTTFILSLGNDAIVARHLSQSAGLVNYANTLNDHVKIVRFVSLRDNVSVKAPEHVEGELKNAFDEGSACLSIECYNAAATMFRLCVDLATQPLLPDSADTTKSQPNSKQRRNLGLRLPWLFENRLVPSDLRELAHCIKEEGNDGAHAGTLTKEDAEDLLDFTVALLERLVTEPKKLKLAEARRQARRK